MMVSGYFPRTIQIRFPDDETQEGYVYDPAFLIHPSIAIGCKAESIEIYKLKQAEQQDIYELVSMLDPLEIRNSEGLHPDKFVQDASSLTFGEFWNRYIEVF